MRVVVDTNVIVNRFLSPSGVPAQLIAAWQQQSIDIVVTESILAESARALGYPAIKSRHGLKDNEIRAVIQEFARFSIVVVAEATGDRPSLDPDDDKFLDCAVAGEAQFIVSGDRHLLELHEYRGVRIVRAAVLLALLRGDE
ncbi:MAG TPA: putative toxin-antitoxin system toxin component, PIN family [Chloroflexota bacterium]|nr:putative toxin-antitoxin system toxin component, PIN family [Chloroflexota bacterium]